MREVAGEPSEQVRGSNNQEVGEGDIYMATEEWWKGVIKREVELSVVGLELVLVLVGRSEQNEGCGDWQRRFPIRNGRLAFCTATSGNSH